jgi:hypothetical protein
VLDLSDLLGNKDFLRYMQHNACIICDNILCHRFLVCDIEREVQRKLTASGRDAGDRSHPELGLQQGVARP